MEVGIEETSKLGRRINVTFPVEKIIENMQSKFKKLSHKVNINGFRPGHVPVNIIKQKFGMAVYQEVIDHLINSGIKDVIEKYNLDPIGQLILESINNNEQVNLESLEDLKCIFKVDVYPDFDLKEFNEFSINTSEIEITEEDIDERIEIIRQELGSFVETDKKAQLGDLLVLDYEFFVAGEKITDGDRKKIDFLLEEDTLIEGFGTGLVGSKALDDIVLNLNFPKDYPENSLAGKQLEVKIHVHKVKVKQLAEINEEFASKIGIQDKDINKIRATIKKQLKEYAAKLIIQKEEDTVKNLLIKAYPIDELPDKFVAEDLQRLEQNFYNDSMKQGINIKELNPLIKEKLKAQAMNNVHISLILRKIIQKYNLTIDQQVLQEKLSSFEQWLKIINKNANSKNHRTLYENLKKSIINSSILQVAIDFIREKITKIVNPITFKQLNS